MHQLPRQGRGSCTCKPHTLGQPPLWQPWSCSCGTARASPRWERRAERPRRTEANTTLRGKNKRNARHACPGGCDGVRRYMHSLSSSYCAYCPPRPLEMPSAAPSARHVHGAAPQHPSPQASFPGAPPARAQIEEVESVCYWVRQLIALVCGLACGMTSTQGVPGFVLFGSLHMILGAGVLRNSAAANDASAERRWALVQEGLTASVGTFLVTWTLATGRTA